MDDTKSVENQLEELTKRIVQLEQTLRRSIEATSSLHIGTVVEGTRASMLSSVMTHVQDDNSALLAQCMPPSCDMYERCKGTFETMLRESLEELAGGAADEKRIASRRETLRMLSEKASGDHCGQCFDKASELYEKQVRLMRSMRVYKTPAQEKQDIGEIPAEAFVKGVLEPIANKARLQMLQAVAKGTMTFSALSELTGLRGGNLLFHLNKLIASEMVIQRHERGDYMITEKGYRTLAVLSELAAPP
jgi:DNA-binding HxlR family transcriptional regulator/bacterioferritin-associated ferredoxin